jgi:hypothetical protein
MKLSNIILVLSTMLFITCSENTTLNKKEELMKYKPIVHQVIDIIFENNSDCELIERQITNLLKSKKSVTGFSFYYTNKTDCFINKKSKKFNNRNGKYNSFTSTNYYTRFYYTLNPYFNVKNIKEKGCSIHLVEKNGNIICRFDLKE